MSCQHTYCIIRWQLWIMGAHVGVGNVQDIIQRLHLTERDIISQQQQFMQIHHQLLRVTSACQKESDLLRSMIHNQHASEEMHVQCAKKTAMLRSRIITTKVRSSYWCRALSAGNALVPCLLICRHPFRRHSKSLKWLSTSKHNNCAKTMSLMKSWGCLCLDHQEAHDFLNDGRVGVPSTFDKRWLPGRVHEMMIHAARSNG